MELSANRAYEIIDRCRDLATLGLLTTDQAAEIVERLRTRVDHADPAAGPTSARGSSRARYRT